MSPVLPKIMDCSRDRFSCISKRRHRAQDMFLHISKTSSNVNQSWVVTPQHSTFGTNDRTPSSHIKLFQPFERKQYTWTWNIGRRKDRVECYQHHTQLARIKRPRDVEYSMSDCSRRTERRVYVHGRHSYSFISQCIFFQQIFARDANYASRSTLNTGAADRRRGRWRTK